nr:retrovirus-related Pol polyprotein from transposon TNT 1-94 [Tanacetum cinerariifolium]
ADKEIPISEDSPVTRTESQMETYKIVSLKQDESINVQNLETNLYWEFGKFTSQDGESLESYYSRFYKMMNELIRNQCDITNHLVNVQFLLQPKWQRFVTLVKQSQELKTVSYHKLYDILKQHQNEVNEIRAKRIARVANPLALVAQQQPVYNPQTHPTHYTQNSSTRSQQAATRNREKAIDNRSVGYENQRIGNVARAKETVGLTVVQKSGIQSYNCKEFGHVARECQKPKWVKDAAYHREKMLLCKQEEAGIQLNAEQAEWRDDTDDELEDQELEAHYMYMAQLQEVSPDTADSGPIFDDEPLQKVSKDDYYNVFAIESEHPEKSETIHDTYPIKQDAPNVIIDSLYMSYDIEEIDQNDDDNDLANEHKLLASLIEKLKCEIDENKNRKKILETSNKVLVENLKEIVLFIIDSGCSKHMTGNLKLLINFVEKFMGTVKFRNDQIAPILGYRDLVQGAVMIKKVYYVEGLNHNLFSVGKFCDADLEVTFRKSTCYICDLKGNDLLTGSCGTDLYSIILQDSNSFNPICLMAKATSSQARLWHRHLSHLNFDTINLLSKNDIVVGLLKLKFIKDHLCSSCELGKANR